MAANEKNVVFLLNGLDCEIGENKPFFIGVAGGTASGKTTVCEQIMEKLGEDQGDRVVIIGQESFYKNVSKEDHAKALKGQHNFDHPGALDFHLMYQTLMDIKSRKIAKVPEYDFRTNSRLPECRIIHPSDVHVVLFEGILAFYDKRMRDMFNMKLFVDTDPDTRLERRVRKDILEMHRDLDYVLSQYINFVKPAFEEFCLPTKKYADVIIPRGAENLVAIDLIMQHIQDLLHGVPKKNLVAPPTTRVRHNSDSMVSRPH